MGKHFKEENKKVRRKNKKAHKLLFFILILLIIFSIAYIIKYFLNKNDVINESQLLNTVEIDENSIPEGKTERMLQVAELQKQNSDIVGWVQIDETKINYPVLQGEDNSYYMNHNSKKEQSEIGSIFLDKDYNWDIPSSNLLMYGHNIKDGSMFKGLLNYRDKKYYEEHPNVRFTTEKEDRTFEIISAFYSRVYYKSEKNVFRYYYFINANNEKEYNTFVKNAKKASLYDTGKTAQYGDQLITLSTCSYHVEDGRFVVVARELKK